jgi:hypothetical protein
MGEPEAPRNDGSRPMEEYQDRFEKTVKSLEAFERKLEDQVKRARDDSRVNRMLVRRTWLTALTCIGVLLVAFLLFLGSLMVIAARQPPPGNQPPAHATATYRGPTTITTNDDPGSSRDRSAVFGFGALAIAVAGVSISAAAAFARIGRD